jgi:hypothetical protein
VSLSDIVRLMARMRADVARRTFADLSRQALAMQQMTAFGRMADALMDVGSETDGLANLSDWLRSQRLTRRGI